MSDTTATGQQQARKRLEKDVIILGYVQEPMDRMDYLKQRIMKLLEEPGPLEYWGKPDPQKRWRVWQLQKRLGGGTPKEEFYQALAILESDGLLIEVWEKPKHPRNKAPHWIVKADQFNRFKWQSITQIKGDRATIERLKIRL